jgi:hypothetical protein
MFFEGKAAKRKNKIRDKRKRKGRRRSRLLSTTNESSPE